MTTQHHSPDLAAQPLNHATALPARFYTDATITPLERRSIFDRSWQLIAHVSQLRNIGDHTVSMLSGDAVGGLPVIAVRGADDVIRVMHNVCRHRAGPLAQCDGLAAKSLRCRYHGWTYSLDGQLRTATEMTGATDFDVNDIRLPQLAVRVWRGLVFAAVDETSAPPFETFVAGIDARIGADRGLEHYGHHHRVGYDIACNWKVYVDNFLEGYHLPHIHPELNRLLDYRSYITETAEWHSLQWSPLESVEGLYGSGDALYYWLWPNTMLNILPGRLQTNRILPKGAHHCRVEFDFYYATDDSDPDSNPDVARARREADLSFSDVVQDEDITICEDVQRGLASGSYDAGRLNPLRENAVHHFHEILRNIYRNAE